MMRSAEVTEARTTVTRVENSTVFKIVTKDKTLNITIPDTEVTASKADSVGIPKGTVRMDPEEHGGWAWRNSEEFREFLYQHAVWTGKTGLKSSREQKIEADGKFTPTKDYDSLSVAERAYHYKGDGLVALGVYYDRGRGLDVDAVVGADIRLRVAFVSLGEAEPQKSNALQAVESAIGGLEKTQKEVKEKAEALRKEVDLLKSQAATKEEEATRLETQYASVGKEIEKHRKAAELLRNE